MSDQRTFGWLSGRLITSSLIKLMELPVIGTKNPADNLPLEIVQAPATPAGIVAPLFFGAIF